MSGRGGCIGACVMRRGRRFVASTAAATRGAVDRGCVAYDFGALEADGESLEPRERELTVAVLGAMVRDLADDLAPAERRVLLDRGVLLAGLRALSESEAVALIAVDRLGWEQRELADRLGVEFGRLRETLFNARKLFYGVVRHAVGVEVDEEERARLHAYQAGELVGRERRLGASSSGALPGLPGPGSRAAALYRGRAAAAGAAAFRPRRPGVGQAIRCQGRRGRRDTSCDGVVRSGRRGQGTGRDRRAAGDRGRG